MLKSGALSLEDEIIEILATMMGKRRKLGSILSAKLPSLFDKRQLA